MRKKGKKMRKKKQERKQEKYEQVRRYVEMSKELLVQFCTASRNQKWL